MTLLARVPWWGWLALALVAYGAVMEYRVSAANARVRAVEERVEAAKLEELGQERAAIAKQSADLLATRGRLEADARRLKAQGEAIAAALGRIDGELSKVRAEGRQLVETGTVDEVAAAGRALGYHPVPMARPR